MEHIRLVEPQTEQRVMREAQMFLRLLLNVKLLAAQVLLGVVLVALIREVLVVEVLIQKHSVTLLILQLSL